MALFVALCSCFLTALCAVTQRSSDLALGSPHSFETILGNQVTPPVIAALVAAIAALATSIVSLVAGRNRALLEHRLASQRDQATRSADLERIMLRFRHPLLHAATDLQGRLWNIVRGRLLQVYGRGSDEQRRYTIESTLFVFAEYLGWVEALRREVQFLDIGGDASNRQLQDLLESISSALSTDGFEPEFMIFRTHQRAIGEVMLVPRAGGGLECIGFATFSDQLADPIFARWFTKLREDIATLTARPQVDSSRIERVQSALVDLMDTLDPSSLRVPATRRGKLTTQTPQGRLPN